MASYEVALPAHRLIVDVQEAKRVTLGMLNTHDDAYGDHWLIYEMTPEQAEEVAAAIVAQAGRAREVKP